MGLSKILKTQLNYLVLLIFSMSLFACSKAIPERNFAYYNDFENTDIPTKMKVYNAFGLVDSNKIARFNNNNVFGRFNSNFVVLQVDSTPAHNVLKIEFDLFLHDNWKGNFIPPGGSLPDIFQVKLDNNPIMITTFSNDNNPQSFPANYQPTMINNPAFSNSWGTMEGACSKLGQKNGTSWYRLEFFTLHKGPIEMSFQDVLFTASDFCTKSWSIDNIKLTAINKQ